MHADFNQCYMYVEVLIELLTVLVADSDIRFCVLSSLDERFDAHLAQAENLSALFVALNDEVRVFKMLYMLYMYVNNYCTVV